MVWSVVCQCCDGSCPPCTMLSGKMSSSRSRSRRGVMLWSVVCQCCDGSCPPCTMLCGKMLGCRQHKCCSVCHQGYYSLCTQLSLTSVNTANKHILTIVSPHDCSVGLVIAVHNLTALPLAGTASRGDMKVCDLQRVQWVIVLVLLSCGYCWIYCVAHGLSAVSS